MEITVEVKSIIKNAAKKLTGYKRRAFQAQTTLDLLDGNSRQAEPRFRTTLAYTRITAKAVRAALIAEKGYADENLPGKRTMSNILNRLGYCLRRVEKTKPVNQYEHGVKVVKEELQPFAEWFMRSETLPKWDITIDPQPG